MEKDKKEIVLVNSNYILKKIMGNSNISNIIKLFEDLEKKYGKCIHVSNEVEIIDELTGNVSPFFYKFEEYVLPLTDYQIVNETLLKGYNCILCFFFLPQLQTFKYDFSSDLDKIYVYNEGLNETKKLNEYLKSINNEFIAMKSVDSFSSSQNFIIKYSNSNLKKCSIENGNSFSSQEDFLSLNVKPELNYNEVTLKLLNDSSNSSTKTNYNVVAFNRLCELSSNENLPREIKKIFPDFLVYNDEFCVGYGYDNPLDRSNLKTLKQYLEIEAKTDNSEKTFFNLLQVAKKFLCMAKIFQSYNIYFYNMDLEDFEITLDNNGNIDSILPINCENLCIDGVTTNNNINEICNIKKFLERYNSNPYQSYFYDNFLLYIVLKIITLDIDNKDYKILKNSINRLKFSSAKYISNSFERVSWCFFDEIGNIFVENKGHFSINNMVVLLNSCKFGNESLFNKFTKRDLFHISMCLLILCVISVIVITILIL